MTHILYTSDSHIGHDRIRQYTHRPFADREQMDVVLYQRLREAKATGARRA
jgi:calcineurin-like phosphoesterase family protein